MGIITYLHKQGHLFQCIWDKEVEEWRAEERVEEEVEERIEKEVLLLQLSVFAFAPFSNFENSKTSISQGKCHILFWGS